MVYAVSVEDFAITVLLSANKKMWGNGLRPLFYFAESSERKDDNTSSNEPNRNRNSCLRIDVSRVAKI